MKKSGGRREEGGGKRKEGSGRREGGRIEEGEGRRAVIFGGGGRGLGGLKPSPNIFNLPGAPPLT